jgi:hypothetical protein
MIASLLARLVLPAPVTMVMDVLRATLQSVWDAFVTVLAHPSVLILIGMAFGAGWWQGTTKGARQLQAYIASQERAIAIANNQVATLNARVDALAAAAEARRAATTARVVHGVPDLPKCVAECGLPAESIAHLNSLN